MTIFIGRNIFVKRSSKKEEDGFLKQKTRNVHRVIVF
jgi:hypothetical protein